MFITPLYHPPDGKLLIWGEADSKNNISIFAMDLFRKNKVKVTEELGATGGHIGVSWDSKAVAFGDEIASVESGKKICEFTLNDIREFCEFAKK